MFGLGLSGILPSNPRRKLVGLVTGLRRAWDEGGRHREERRLRQATLRFQRWAHRRQAGHTPYRGRSVAVIGFFRSRIGLGRAAELLARELSGDGASVYRIDATAAVGLVPNIDRQDCLDLRDLPSLPVTDLVLHMNPPELHAVLERLPRAVFRRRSLVGYFAWELDRCPPSWRAVIHLVDAIWVPSSFVRDSIVATVPGAFGKTVVKPHRVDLDAALPPTLEERRAARARLGLEPGQFVALTSFSVLSTLARKNPGGAIEAFKQAFEPDASACLIVRCLDGEGFTREIAILRDALGGDPRIRLVLEPGKGTAIEPYYAAADAYLSLHRSEGFGLNLAEALMRGLPVVATGWSLGETLLGHPLLYPVPWSLIPVIDSQGQYAGVPDALWAEPDLTHAAQTIRRLATGCPPP